MSNPAVTRPGRVLILGNDTRVTLAVVRSLGRRQLEVHVGWHDERSPAIASRYVHTLHHIPPFHEQEDDWKLALHELLRRHCFDLVIPCNDPTLIPLQLYRNEFEGVAPIYLLDEDVFPIVFDKIHTTALAKQLGVPVPRSVIGSRRDETLAACRQLRFPLYVKPRSSVTPADLINKREVRRADNMTELTQHLNAFSETEVVLVQESFEGVGLGVEVLASKGKVLAELHHRRLHESLAGGSTYRETIPPDARLSAATQTMIQALNYTGVAMFEYRAQPDIGDWVLLEINARFWGSLPLAIAAGMDFPGYLYQLLVEKKEHTHTEYRRGRRARNLVEDLRWMKRQLANDFGSALGVIADLARIVTGRDTLDQWAWDDWRPQVIEILQLLQSSFKSLAARLLGRPTNFPPRPSDEIAVDVSPALASPLDTILDLPIDESEVVLR